MGSGGGGGHTTSGGDGYGSQGGTTRFYGYEAQGGYGGEVTGKGGDGGSGGGAGFVRDKYYGQTEYAAGSGGSNGANGTSPAYTNGGFKYPIWGSGQGTSTVCPLNGVLYSGGGAGSIQGTSSNLPSNGEGAAGNGGRGRDFANTGDSGTPGIIIIKCYVVK